MRPAVPLVCALCVALLVAASAGAAEGPRYDVPPGFTRCPHATAWNGFFKWASVRATTCRSARRLMRRYARESEAGRMPRRVGRYRCRLRYWRTQDGEVYASRHRCAHGEVVVRFYGAV